MCGGGGSGGSGVQQYNWNPVLAPEWANAISWARGLTDPNGAGAYHQYTGPDPSVYGSNSPIFAATSNDPTHRIADLTAPQQAAMQQIWNYTADPTYGVQDPNQAQNAGLNLEQKTLSSPATADPYATTANPYVGLSNPAFQQTMQSGLDDMAAAYQRGTAADLNRDATLGGVVGGSAYNNAQSANQYALAKQMSNYVSGMQNDQINRSAQLMDSALGRASQSYQDSANRQIQTIPLAQQEQNLALQRAQSLMGIGDVQRSYNQDLTNQAYTDWQSQQNRQYQMLDYLSGILGRAQGGVSPNMQYTLPGYQASPYSQILGGGLLASQFLGGH